MGIETSRDVRNGGDDTALLAMPTSDLIWTGPIGQPVRAVDKGYATNPDGVGVAVLQQVANQEGDSGAAMARYQGGQLKVTGVVSAGSGDVPCQYNYTVCFGNVYCTAMDEILYREYPGATLRTG